MDHHMFVREKIFQKDFTGFQAFTFSFLFCPCSAIKKTEICDHEFFPLCCAVLLPDLL